MEQGGLDHRRWWSIAAGTQAGLLQGKLGDSKIPTKPTQAGPLSPVVARGHGSCRFSLSNSRTLRMRQIE